ncbi:MAG: flagellar biosynthetic protein FliR [Gemmatimonadaceae bacterium]|nr:flagellar biosynthetic protein FliR [Gemmatimonadaceae bacterium]
MPAPASLLGGSLPDLFAPRTVEVLALTVLRLGGLVLIAPVWSARTMPMRVRTAALLTFSICLLPTALADAPPTVGITPATFVSETVIGLAIGLAAACTVAAAELAGELLAIEIGLSGAALFDPLSQQPTQPLGQFLQLAAITILLVGNGHVVMLEALAASMHAIPVGVVPDLAAGLKQIALLGGSVFDVGLRVAAPVLAAVMVANIALGMLSRAAPSLNVMAVAFPLQIGVGLLSLSLAFGAIALVFTGWDASLARVLDAVFRPMLVGATGGVR